MKRRNSVIILLFAALTAFTSCEKELNDSEKPVIVLSSPVEDAEIRPGSTLHFEMTLSDNEALASYKVNIHGAFDGHEHSASATTRVSEYAQPFERTWLESDFIALGEEPIAGKKRVTIHHHLMQVPDSIGGRPVKEGHYHLTLYCTDAEGQESFLTREVLILYDAEEHVH